MRSEIEQHGLLAFNAAALAHHWQAPPIPSAWYVANVSPVEQRPYWKATRDLGSALLAAIDAWAPAMRADAPSGTLAKAAALVDLAWWMGATDGYGNLLLAHRARDVAVTGLARRVADLDTPLAETAAQVQRLHAPFDAPLTRARILNFEAGTRLFPAGPDTSDGDIAGVWSRRLLNDSWRKLPTPGPMPNEPNEALQWVRGLAAAVGFTPAPPQATDAFFVDDPDPQPLTTRSAWDVKQHARLTATTLPQSVYGLEILVRFREVIGQFPLQPGVRQETVSSPGEEAFANAWRPHIGTDTTNLGRAAWNVFDRITRGEFLDADSTTTRLLAAAHPQAGSRETPSPAF